MRVNKSATALLGAGLMWTIYALMSGASPEIARQLGESVTGTAQIVFFLMGAMAIVEVVDAHNGFDVITRRIRTASLPTLLWLVSFVTFILSAILDSLTTTIVMVSLMRKLLGRAEDRLFFAGIIVIAANSGGAWSPIGDVTTTMLWIGGQITSIAIIQGGVLAVPDQHGGPPGGGGHGAGAHPFLLVCPKNRMAGPDRLSCLSGGVSRPAPASARWAMTSGKRPPRHPIHF